MWRRAQVRQTLHLESANNEDKYKRKIERKGEKEGKRERERNRRMRNTSRTRRSELPVGSTSPTKCSDRGKATPSGQQPG